MKIFILAFFVCICCVSISFTQDGTGPLTLEHLTTRVSDVVENSNREEIAKFFTEALNNYAAKITVHKASESVEVANAYSRLQGIVQSLKPTEPLQFSIYTVDVASQRQVLCGVWLFVDPASMHRQIAVDYRVLQDSQLSNDMLRAILAHELGHDLLDQLRYSVATKITEELSQDNKEELQEAYFLQLQTAADCNAVLLLRRAGFDPAMLKIALKFFSAEFKLNEGKEFTKKRMHALDKCVHHSKK